MKGTWTYEQSTGRIFDDSGSYITTGYAGGNCGANPEGVNSPECEPTPKVGPLPAGIYYALAPEDSSELGPFAIPLSPAEGNVMYGRGGFFMHGDNKELNKSASEGCIIMPRSVREQFASSKCNLQVVAAIGD